jgi:hypothetical protein
VAFAWKATLDTARAGGFVLAALEHRITERTAST